MLKSPVVCHLLDAGIALLLIVALLAGADAKWVLVFMLAGEIFGKIAKALTEFMRPIIEALGHRA